MKIIAGFGVLVLIIASALLMAWPLMLLVQQVTYLLWPPPL